MDPNPNGGREIAVRVRRDTGVFQTLARRARRAAAFLAVAATFLTWPATSHGASADAMRHRLLWSRGNHAYVALGDAIRAEEGDSVRFDDRRNTIAGGRIVSVIHGELAFVSLTSGSLDRVKRPERVGVSTMRPALRVPPTLRIALPSDDRGNLLFRCAAVTPRLPDGAPGYRTEPIDPISLRLIREAPAPDSGPWPDTLHVSFFYDPADEEIALERGDVDVAVFWPGELSRRVREDARWRGFPLGTRNRGVLVLERNSPMIAPDTAWAASFNEALFRGDLGLRELRSGSLFLATIGTDGALPGKVPIQQWLTRHSFSSATTGVSLPPGVQRPYARFALFDAPADTASSDRFVPLYTLRCPVLSAAPLRPLVRALGADALANLPQCIDTPAR